MSYHFIGLISPAKGTQHAVRDILGMSYMDDDGQWCLISAKQAGARILTDEGKLIPTSELRKERLGVPPGWREAAAKLPKDDCTCVDECHLGPHWLHMDFMDRERNAEYVKPPMGSMLAFVQEESQRAGELLKHMTRLGIEDMRVYLGVK